MSNEESNLVVLRFDLVAVADADTVKVCLKPTSLADEGADTDAGVTTGFDFATDRIAIANFSGG